MMKNKENLVRKIGGRLKDIRKITGLTLKRLADETNLSPGLISRIENGYAMPSILTLQELSVSLKVDIEEFFKESESQRYVISRSGERKTTLTDRGYEVEYPAEGMENPFMEPAIVVLEGKDKEGEIKEASHGGQEFLYVLEGKVELTLGKKRFTLRKGDTAYFDGEIQHKGISLSKKPAKSLNVHLIPGRRVGSFEPSD